MLALKAINRYCHNNCACKNGTVRCNLFPMETTHFEQLQPLYKEYRQVIDGIHPESTVQVYWRAELVPDKLKDAISKIGVYASSEELEEARSKALYQNMSARDCALINNGFAGTIKDIFQRLDKDGLISESDVVLLSVLRKIPDERVKGATLIGGQNAYYWGGIFTEV